MANRRKVLPQVPSFEDSSTKKPDQPQSSLNPEIEKLKALANMELENLQLAKKVEQPPQQQPPLPKQEKSKPANDLIDFDKIDLLFKKKKVQEKPESGPQVNAVKPPLDFLPSAISLADKSKYALEREEYDPGRPNDYDEMKKIKQKRERELEQKKKQEIEQELKEREQQKAELPAKKSGTRKALEIMEKLGYKQGMGLGKEGQGIVAPIIHQKIGENQAIFTQGSADLNQLLTYEEIIEKNLEDFGLKPTRVLLLMNLVNLSEVDDQLEGEILEECCQYGQIITHTIHITPEAPEEQQVKIFILYSKIEESKHAWQNLHKRYFGMRTIEAMFYEEFYFDQGDLEGPINFPLPAE